MTIVKSVRRLTAILALAVPIIGSSAPSAAETPGEWVTLGQRIHGEFGSLIALGIRIGTDATQRVEARGRALDVTYQDGPAAPCTCVADGVMLATGTSPGQDTLHIAGATSDRSVFGTVIVTDKKRHRMLRYTIPASAAPIMDRVNAAGEGRARYDAVMAVPAHQLFHIETKTVPE